MDNPYQQLLLSALALTPGTDLIAQFRASCDPSPLVGMVNEGLDDAICSASLDDGDWPDTFEVFPGEQPGFSVVLPVTDDAGQHTSAVVYWTPALCGCGDGRMLD
jgi:hypothetical protein